MTKKHDEHYTNMHVQPITAMEERAQAPVDLFDDGDFPDEIERLNLAIALKYIMRAGKKEGQPWKKDIEKAANHLHRAMTGAWLPGDKKSDTHGLTRF